MVTTVPGRTTAGNGRTGSDTVRPVREEPEVEEVVTSDMGTT
jgi:hypothetical protein